MYKTIEQDGNNWVQCICDKCGKIAENEEEGFDLMPDELASSNLAMEQGWQTWNNEHLCPSCRPEEL